MINEETALHPTACPICQQEELGGLYEFTSSAVPGRIVVCQGCGLLFKRIPKGFTLEDVYDDAYAEVSKASDYMNGAYTRRFFAQILERTGIPGEGRRLLDVGTGTGTLLEVAAERGFDAEGVELNPTLAETARTKGFTVHTQNVEEIDFATSFDVITMLDLIEHVYCAPQLLAACYRALKPSGCLVVFTPNHRGAVVTLARMLNAVGVRGPLEEIFGGLHVAFYDDRTLANALDQTGYRVDAIWRFPYDLKRPGQPIPPVALMAVGAVEWLGWPFGRTFRMVAYARKP